MTRMESLLKFLNDHNGEPGNQAFDGSARIPRFLQIHPPRTGEKSGCVGGSWIGDVHDPLHEGNFVSSKWVRDALAEVGLLNDDKEQSDG